VAIKNAGLFAQRVGQVKKKENGWHIGQPFSPIGKAKIQQEVIR
jgi:hypothetical protein